MNIYIAIPSYGQLDCAVVSSLFNNIRVLQENGHKVQFHFEVGNSLIVYARNKLCDLFLKSGADVMIFLDSDICTMPDSMLKLVNKKEYIIAGAYPKRTGDFEFPVLPFLKEDGTPKLNGSQLIEADYVPTGFMKISKLALLLYAKAFPERLQWDDETGDKQYCWFDTGVHPEVFGNHKWYGEDVFFCTMARKSGLKIYIEPDINFDHIGNRNVVSGNYKNYLTKSTGVYNISLNKKGILNDCS